MAESSEVGFIASSPEAWTQDNTAVGGVGRLAPPPRSLMLSAAALAGSVGVSLAVWLLLFRAVDKLHTTHAWITGTTIGASVFASLATVLVVPGVHALVLSHRARTLEASGEIVAARRVAARAREKALRTFGFGFAVLIVLAVMLFLLSSNAAVVQTFISWKQMSRSAGDVIHAFWLNVWIALAAEAAILVSALTLALLRYATGRAAAPIRLLAIAYVDTFRAIPLIIVLYLVAFGIPIAQVPVLSNLPTPWLIVIGLTLTNSAYVAEVFRSGIESVHWSQTAAARSLGFTTVQAWRFVVVPQAFRRVLPPLLSYFIGLQKDTALVLVVGAIDAFGQAKIYAGNYFNLSSVTFVAFLFIVVTIPQTRLVDLLLARQARKMGVRAL